MRISLVSYFVIFLVLSGCTESTSPAQNISSNLIGRWQLERFINDGGTVLKPVPYDGIYQAQLLFQADNNLKGTSARNDLDGNYQLKAGNIIKINSSHSEIMETTWGNLFLKSLPLVSSYRISNDSLVLSYGEHRQMIFIKLP